MLPIPIKLEKEKLVQLKVCLTVNTCYLVIYFTSGPNSEEVKIVKEPEEKMIQLTAGIKMMDRVEDIDTINIDEESQL